MFCKHINEIIDHHSGSYVCLDCGLVKETCFMTYEKSVSEDSQSNINEPISNFIEMFHTSKNVITKHTNIKHLHTKRNLKNVASELYQKSNNNIPLKEIMNVTRLNSRDILSNKIHQTDIIRLVDKYSPFFGMTFKECKIIKEQAKNFDNTGYQPLTIIGGLFYLYLKKKNVKFSIKNVSEKLGISSISIQRFSKYFKCNFIEDSKSSAVEVCSFTEGCKSSVVEV